MSAIVGAVLKFATSRLGLGLIGGVVLMLVVGAHLAGDAKARHDRDQARTAAKAWHSAADDWKHASGVYQRALGRSETLRGEEYTDAKAAVSEAASDCAARLTEARRSASAIRSLLEKPIAKAPGTNCPARRVYSADELRHVLEAPR